MKGSGIHNAAERNLNGLIIGHIIHCAVNIQSGSTYLHAYQLNRSRIFIQGGIFPARKDTD